MKKEDKTNNLSLFLSLPPPTITKHHEEGRQTEQSLPVSVSSHHEEDKSNNDQELNRKRKNSGQNFQIPYLFQELEEEKEEGPNLQLTLSLSFRPAKTRRPLSVAQPPESPSPTMDHRSLSVQSLFSETPQLPETLQLTPSHPLCLYVSPLGPESSTPTPPPPLVYRHEAGTRRVRRNPALRDGKSDTVPALFPWAATRRAHVHSLDYLRSKQIITVTGEVQCKKCQRQYEMAYPLEDKFKEVGYFIAINRDSMRDRAPAVWSNPHFPTCNFCGEENSAKPIISEKKKTINWLFLLLGQFLGCLTLEQLKYFCKHTQNHRTGAKDRVLYLTYLALCKQLDPNGPFDR